MRVIGSGLTVVASASLALAGCVSNDGLPEATPMNPAEMYAVVAATDECPSFGSLSVAGLPRGAWDQPSPSPHHARIRARIAPPATEPHIWLSVSGGSGHHIGYDANVVAIRVAPSEWRVTSEMITTDHLPPPPPPGGGPSTYEATRASREAWTLRAEHGERLNRLLTSRCLAAEPRSVRYPAPGPCRGVASVETVIRAAGVEQRWAQECGQGGAAGEITKIILRMAQ